MAPQLQTICTVERAKFSECKANLATWKRKFFHLIELLIIAHHNYRSLLIVLISRVRRFFKHPSPKESKNTKSRYFTADTKCAPLYQHVSAGTIFKLVLVRSIWGLGGKWMSSSGYNLSEQCLANIISLRDFFFFFLMIGGIMFGMHSKSSPLARPSPCQDTRNDALAGQSSRRRLQPICAWLFIQEETGQQWWRAGTSCPFWEKNPPRKILFLTSSKCTAPITALPAFGVGGNGRGWNKWKTGGEKTNNGIKKSAEELFNMLKTFLRCYGQWATSSAQSHPEFPKDKVSQCPHKEPATLCCSVFVPAKVRQAHRFIPFIPFHWFHLSRQAHSTYSIYLKFL